MNWKGLGLGVALIILAGIGGFLYRSYKEQPQGPTACTTDAKLCPDGTGLGRTGPSCTFPTCPPPNVELASIGLAFALPQGYTAVVTDDPEVLGSYQKTDSATGLESNITIRRFMLNASTTAAAFIRENALLDPSGLPAPATAFTSVTLGDAQHQHHFSVVQIGRFEGLVDTAYYLAREHEVLRFDAISRNVLNWTDPAFDVNTLAANQDLRALLATLQGN